VRYCNLKINSIIEKEKQNPYRIILYMTSEGGGRMHEIIEALGENPIIGAIRSEDDLEDVIRSSAQVVFILSGNLLNIGDMTQYLKSRGKKVCIHLDLIEGLGKDHAAIDFLKKYANPDGCITTKVTLAKYARQAGLFTILRLFIIDSHSLITGIKNVHETSPDAVEVMPGIASKLVERIIGEINVPVIAGGLISTKDDIIDALSAGVLAVSTSAKHLWNM
jgi:glycerol uptake operon antiterminator